MSSTNRGKKRNEYDFYATPTEVVENILDNLDLGAYGNRVLEASAGNGNICSVVKRRHPEKYITAIEIREEEKETLEQCSDNVIIGDFLGMEVIDKFDIIIGNPPYSVAIDFVKKSLECLSDEGVLVLLLRTAFLESKSRFDFWQENELSGLYTLSRRPSFTGKGTDSTSYSWFVWDKKNKGQIIRVI